MIWPEFVIPITGGLTRCFFLITTIAWNAGKFAPGVQGPLTCNTAPSLGHLHLPNSLVYEN